MCGGTLIGKIVKNHPDILGQEIILEKVMDQDHCQHFPHLGQNQIISAGLDPELRQVVHLKDPQAKPPQTTPWGQAVAWTRGWTGTGWWTVC